MRHEIRIDVTGAVASGETLSVAATVCLPDRSSRPDRRIAFFGFPGGGYNRRYFDLQIPAHAGYSQAEHALAGGHVFVAVDHLGVGDSDTPARPLDHDDLARANGHVATEILALLRSGGLAAGAPPLALDAAVGMGQSYGGFLLVISEGTAPVFDAVAVLGYSSIQTQTPWPPELSVEEMLSLPGNGLDHVLRPAFHHDDVPDGIVIADMTKLPGTLASTAAWSTPSNPGGPALVMRRRPRDRGVVAVEAARITTPVLVACGSNDVVPDPWAEPTAYRSARQVTVAVVPQMAHMHNFASTRRELWELIARWADSVVPA